MVKTGRSNCTVEYYRCFGIERSSKRLHPLTTPFWFCSNKLFQAQKSGNVSSLTKQTKNEMAKQYDTKNAYIKINIYNIV